MPEAYILSLLLDPYFSCTALLRTAVAGDYSHSMAAFFKVCLPKCSIFSFSLLISHGPCIDFSDHGFVLHSCWLQYVGEDSPILNVFLTVSYCCYGP